MYRVIFVDDEPLIRTGISRLIPWSTLSLELCCVLENGAQALDYLRSNPVDIVITDIKMPIMDGIDLVRAAYEENIPVRFILLSGYKEFEYARTAMKYNITHYLLKPTDESKIIEALVDICGELSRFNDEQQRISHLKHNAAADFLSEYLSDSCSVSQKYSQSNIRYFCNLLTQNNEPCILALFLLRDCRDSLLLFAMKNIVLEIFSGQRILCHFETENKLILLLDASSQDALPALSKKSIDVFRKIFAQTIYTACSLACSFERLPAAYEALRSDIQRQMECLLPCDQSIIDRIKQTVLTELSNPELSLKWIARNILFMNENYLGKLFYKSTGMKFNQYLTEIKVSEVKRLLKQDHQVKVISLCEAVGFENNPAYLSTLFKNQTGMTLTEFRKKQSRF